MTTIGGINYQIGMDVSGFTEGTVLTRREMQLVRREMREARGPFADLDERINAVKQAFVNSGMEAAEYHAIMVNLNSQTPAARAAQAEYNETVAHAERVLKSLKTPMQEYLEEVERNRKAEAIGKLTKDEMNAANERARQQLPEVAEAQRQLNEDMKRGQQIIRQNETETEQFNREMRELERLFDVGAIKERDMAREAQRLEREILGVDNATERLSDSMREGRSLTDSLMTAEERRTRELQRAQFLLGRGAISQETYNRQLARSRAEQLQNIPVVGELSSRFMGIHPAAIAAGVGIGALAVEVRAAIAVARVLTREVREQWGEIDELAKSARALHIGTQDLIGLTEAAADLAGVEFSGLEKSLQQITRRVSEAAQGSGEAVDALADLGLTADQMTRLSPADMLREVAGALGNVTNANDQARIAYDLFGRQGIDLLPMLRAGRDGIREIERAQIELGNTLTSLDVTSVERMNDTWNDSQDVLKGIVRDLAVDLAPAMTAISQTLVDSLKPGAALGDDLRTTLEAIPPIIAWGADQTNKWVGMFQLLQAGTRTFAATALEALAAIDRGHAAVNPFAEVNAELQITADSFTRSAQEATSAALARMHDGMSGQMQRDLQRIREENAAAAQERDRQLAGGRDVQAELEANEAASTLINTLREQVRTFGMSEEAAMAMELRQRAAAAATVDTTGELNNQVLAMHMDADAIEELAAKLQQLQEQQATAEAVARLAASLNEQLDTLGMTADEVERYRLAQAGANDADLAMIEATQRQVALKRQRIDQEQQLAEQLANVTSSLEFQRATIGMTADEIEQYRLAQAGATAEQLAAVAALQAEVRARTEQQKLVDQAKQLTDSLMTDEERRAAAIAQATELRDRGLISEEMYARALAKTNDETHRAIDLSRGLTGTMKGSIEEALALDSLRDLLAGGPVDAGSVTGATGSASPPADFGAASGSVTVTPPAAPITVTLPGGDAGSREANRVSELLSAANGLLTSILAAVSDEDRDPASPTEPFTVVQHS